MTRRGVAAAVPVLLLALLAVLLVAEPFVKPANLGIGFPGSYVRAIARTMQHTAVASALAVLFLIALAWSIRRVMLSWLVWQPGRIAVPKLEAAGAATEEEAAELSAIFRERLTLLRLESAAPAPGAVPESAFLDVLDGVSSSDPVSSVVRLLRGSVPRNALTVQGALRKRIESPSFGVTVEVVQQPSQASPVIAFWEHSWEEAARKAADGVTAAILPRTRLCIGPWAAWRGYMMPPKLLIAYERGSLHEQDREFDQARDCYWEALRLDPTNVTIRLQLGQLQEKAGDPLAALISYLRILAFANPGRKLVPRGLHRRGARRECERAITLAKYRAIVLFGDGSIVGHWCHGPTLMSGARRRKRMRKEFRELLKPLADVRRRDPVAEAIARATKTLLAAGPNATEPIRRDLRLELLQCAYRAANELKLSLSRLELRPWTRPLTRRTIDLTRVCLEQRCEMMLFGRGSEVVRHGRLDKITRSVYWAGLRPGPWTLWWPSWLRRWQWHEHYNAACAYALTLRADLPGPPLYDAEETVLDVVGVPRYRVSADTRAAKLAIERLERAISTRDSGFAANWRDWVVHEDPDLLALRNTEEFRAFKEMYFPSDGPPQRERPKGTAVPQHRLIESRYTRDVLYASAMRRSDAWRARATTTLDRGAMQSWCAQDRKLWDRILEITQRPYDWRVRQLLVEELCRPPENAPPTAVRFMRHDELEKMLHPDPQSGETLRTFLDERLTKLRDQIALDAQGQGSMGLANLIKALATVSSSTPRITPRRGTVLCEQHAAIWLSLASWLTVEDGVAPRVADQKPWAEAVQPASDAAWQDLLREIRRCARVWYAATTGPRAKAHEMLRAASWRWTTS
jgi:tetratricopeptide (TPR) repeat protein